MAWHHTRKQKLAARNLADVVLTRVKCDMALAEYSKGSPSSYVYMRAGVPLDPDELLALIDRLKEKDVDNH